MTPKQFYKASTPEQIAAVAQKAGTSVGNFKQIAIANGSVGKALAARLASSSGYQMSEIEILYPERFENINSH